MKTVKCYCSNENGRGSVVLTTRRPVVLTTRRPVVLTVRERAGTKEL